MLFSNHIFISTHTKNVFGESYIYTRDHGGHRRRQDNHRKAVLSAGLQSSALSDITLPHRVSIEFDSIQHYDTIEKAGLSSHIWSDHAKIPRLSKEVGEEESVSIPSRHAVRTRQTSADYSTPCENVEMEKSQNAASLGIGSG